MAKADRMNRKKKDTEGPRVSVLTTTTEMVVETLDNGDIVAQDDQGKYLTKKHYVGTGMLDPYRSWDHRREAYAGAES